MAQPDDASPTWERIERLLDTALELPPGERTAWVQGAARGDPSLLREVQELLAAAEATGGPLEHPPVPLPGCRTVLTGRLAGSWRLLELLGEGGMGCVYLAERADGAFEMRAAVKLIPMAAYNSRLRHRFQRERHVLARLEHPRIARLLDAGITDDGIPFLVMEHVDGEPIDRWCRLRRASPAAIARLLLQVCDAVSYAHGRLVLHRDIKPTNVFVTPEGRVKLLDFSIAALLEDSPLDDKGVTRSGAHPCTPGYAAPEQLRGEVVTVATDVYGIGALAYRLLAWRAPRHLDGDAPVGSLLPGLDRELPPPSRVRANNRLAGDLDAIVLKSAHPDPVQRYGSVAELAEDLRRHLEYRPIRARRTPALQRLARAVRRHPARAVATAAVALASLTLAGTLASRNHTAEVSRRRAEQAAQFLQEVLTAAGPDAVRGVDVRVTELLDRAVTAAGRRLKDQPEVQAAILETLAEGMTRMSLHGRATRVQERALALRRAGPSTGNRALVDCLLTTASIHVNTPGIPGSSRALELLREARGLARRIDGGRGRFTIRVDSLQGSLLLGLPHLTPQRRNAARSLLERALRTAERLDDGELQVKALRAQVGLAKTPGEEVVFMRRVHARAVEVYGPSDIHTLTQRNDLALALEGAGNRAEAERLLREVLEGFRRTHGMSHPETISVLNNLAGVLRDRGRHEAAEAVYRQVLDLRLRSVPDDAVKVGYTLYGLGRSVLGQGRPAEAEGYLERAVAILDRRGLEPLAHIARRWQAECLLLEGRRSEGLELLRVAANGLGHDLGPGDSRTSEVVERLTLARAEDSVSAEGLQGAGLDEGIRPPALEAK